MSSLTLSSSALSTPYLTFTFASHPSSAFSRKTVYLKSLLLVFFFILQSLLLKCFLCATILIAVCILCGHIAHIHRILKCYTWLFHHSVNKIFTYYSLPVTLF